MAFGSNDQSDALTKDEADKAYASKNYVRDQVSKHVREELAKLRDELAGSSSPVAPESDEAVFRGATGHNPPEKGEDA